MQILGKRSKILLIVVAIAMLVAVGVSFAAWDSMSMVKATSGNSSTYANARVGDEILFGNYYQSRTDLTRKDPITWIVVDKDERKGQLTLLSKYILASGSYFGNWYAASGSSYSWNYNGSLSEVGGVAYNQAYVDSTVRAYLNNLERLDLGGDEFTSEGYLSGNKNSNKDTGLLSSIGFSNQLYWTGQSGDSNPLLNQAGFIKRANDDEIYYQRPITNSEYTNRPATKGFYDEAFTDGEKAMIVPKIIEGYIGHRWPDNAHDVSTKSYVEGALDKVWLPSATELNIMAGKDWQGLDDSWANPSDEASSTVFEYFKNKSGDELKNALKATRTELAKDGKAGNYSIPVYDKGSANVKTAISNQAEINSSDHYWTRSPSSTWYYGVRTVNSSGAFHYNYTHGSDSSVRPCVIIKY